MNDLSNIILFAFMDVIFPATSIRAGSRITSYNVCYTKLLRLECLDQFEFQMARLRNPQRVLDRVGCLAEEILHLLDRLEVDLAGLVLETVGVVQVLV